MCAKVHLLRFQAFLFLGFFTTPVVFSPALRLQLPDLPPDFHLNSKGRELWLCAYVTGSSAVLHLDSSLNILDNVQRVTGRFLGSAMKIMCTAGYATKHTPSLTALPHTVKAPNRQLTNGQPNSLLHVVREVNCSLK